MSEHYDEHVGVDTCLGDSALEITLRGGGQDGMETTRVVRIPVQDIPDFVAAVTRNGMYALQMAARRIEVGHCETCGNTGLVDAVKHGRPMNEYCPDCKPWPEPFANTPHIGRRAT